MKRKGGNDDMGGTDQMSMVYQELDSILGNRLHRELTQLRQPMDIHIQDIYGGIGRSGNQSSGPTPEMPGPHYENGIFGKRLRLLQRGITHGNLYGRERICQSSS